MLRNLCKIPKRTFFKKKKTQLEELQQALENGENLSYLVTDIINKNKDLPKLLPPKTTDDGKLTVVMEMDQFLIYSFTPDEEGYLLAPFRKYDYYREMQEFNALLSIYLRKNLQNFLNYVSEQCQPVLWTTAVPQYTQLILDLIDPKKRIKHIFTQESCDRIVHQEQQIDQYVKDIGLLGRDMSRVVLLDSKHLNYWLYPQNCIALQKFRADNTMKKQDLNLMILELEQLKKQKDVRKVLKNKYNIRALLQQCKFL